MLLVHAAARRAVRPAAVARARAALFSAEGEGGEGEGARPTLLTLVNPGAFYVTGNTDRHTVPFKQEKGGDSDAGDQAVRVLVPPEVAPLLHGMERRVGGDRPAGTGDEDPKVRDVLDTGAVVLTGPAGIGKTTVLEMVVSACRAAGWLTLYLPDPRTFTHEGIQVRPGRHEDRNLYDQPELVLPFLKNFYILHQEQLRKVVCKTDGAKERGETMLDLVEHGIRKATDCGVVVRDVREEMKLATEVPTLVAVDDLEALYTKTAYGFEGVDLWPSNLVFPRVFQNFSALGLNETARLANGFVVAASTSKYGNARGVHGERLDVTRHAFPMNRLSAEQTGHFVRDHLANVKTDRTAAGKGRGAGAWAGVSDKDIARVHMMSGGVPKSILKEAAFLPYDKGMSMHAPGGSFATKDRIKARRKSMAEQEE
jgi:hypothetical protein